MKSGIQKTYQGLKSIKVQANYLHTEHTPNLSEALEDDGKVITANHVQNMEGRKNVCYLSWRINILK